MKLIFIHRNIYRSDYACQKNGFRTASRASSSPSPDSVQATVSISQPAEPLAYVQRAIRKALDHPIGTQPRESQVAGVRNDDIMLLCGIGMHCPPTYKENIVKLGADVMARYRVIDNEPQNLAALVDLGVTPGQQRAFVMAQFWSQRAGQNAPSLIGCVAISLAIMSIESSRKLDDLDPSGA